MTRVLVVEDDEALVRTLMISLEPRGFEVEWAGDGRTAIARAQIAPPELAIIDLGLPDMDGVDVVRAVRTRSAVPILILSARDVQEQKVAALDAGADDYVTKPFGMDELLARLRAALRRAGEQTPPTVVEAGHLHIDLPARRIMRDGTPVHLTATEWNLLEVLLRSAGSLVTQRDMLQAVWGPQ